MRSVQSGVRTVAAMAAVAMLAAACAEPEAPTTGTEESTSTSASAATDTAEVAPRHTVDKPAKFDGELFGDDLLVVADDTMSAEDIERIEQLRVAGKPGVSELTQLSVGQFSSENTIYNIAAVDVDAYRHFVPGEYATWNVQWQRVAGGEISMDLDHQEKLPLNSDGYLAVGSGEDKDLLHVGSYADQADTVDGVVNTAWGEALGIPQDNALIISTGQASPQVMRDKIEKEFGKDTFSITDLDIVAQEGLETDARSSVTVVGTFAEAVGTYHYTANSDGTVNPEQSWVDSHIVTEEVPILGEVTCNKYMMPQFRSALLKIQASGLADEIDPDEYAGCYYPRFIAGSSKLSNHSFGLAFDINVSGNQRGTIGELNRGVVDIFKDCGFAWGGDWSYTDPMHFELDKIVSC